MFEIALPADAPFTVAELTAADVDALGSFLDARLRELIIRHEPGSGEARAAYALKVAADAQLDELRLPFRYDDGAPERLKEKATAWNSVIHTVWQWQGTDGYDEDRWRLVGYPAPEKKAEADAPSDPAAFVLGSEGYAEWKKRAGREGDVLREEFLNRPIRRPEEADEAPLSWRSDKVVVYGSVLAHSGLPRTPENENLWRGTAADALSVLAAGESIRRTILAGRAKHIHQGLMLGTTWSEIAEALGRTPDQVRAELRYWADENPDLYYGADRRVPVAALLDLGDDETVSVQEEDR
ncbi:hypothetical protein ACFFTQ_37515 [Streptomyces roseofulvus]|uniref:hypothetical protein n=1 Tax=Streptomyces roseofulvus TaxID=33902 RepID=UPI0035E66968